MGMVSGLLLSCYLLIYFVVKCVDMNIIKSLLSIEVNIILRFIGCDSLEILHSGV